MRRCNSRLSVSTLRRVQTIYGRPQNNKGVFTPSWLIALQPLDVPCCIPEYSKRGYRTFCSSELQCTPCSLYHDSGHTSWDYAWTDGLCYLCSAKPTASWSPSPVGLTSLSALSATPKKHIKRIRWSRLYSLLITVQLCETDLCGSIFLLCSTTGVWQQRGASVWWNLSNFTFWFGLWQLRKEKPLTQ